MPESVCAYREYLDWRGDLTLDADPLRPVDCLLPAFLSYLNFARLPATMEPLPDGGMMLDDTMRELIGVFGKGSAHNAHKLYNRREFVEIGKTAAATRRFAGTRVFGYTSEHDDEREMQFSAVSFLLPDGSVCIAYRGTDGTLVGWKEDFNISFEDAVPAQERALSYLCEIAKNIPDAPLVLCGHSKGGNLAVWAAVHASPDLQERIRFVCSFDGPGFQARLTETEEYRRMIPKIRTYVPKSSIVGTLLEHGEPYHIIDSGEVAVMQHDPVSWKIRGGDFVILEERSPFGKRTDQILGAWISSMSRAERREFSDVLFGVLGAGEAKSFDALAAVSVIRAYAGLDKEKRRLLADRLSGLLAAAWKKPTDALPDGTGELQ